MPILIFVHSLALIRLSSILTRNSLFHHTFLVFGHREPSRCIPTFHCRQHHVRHIFLLRPQYGATPYCRPWRPTGWWPYSHGGTKMVDSVAMVLAKNMAPYIPRARVMARSTAVFMAPYICMASIKLESMAPYILSSIGGPATAKY